jgi:hypothetical protein
MSSYDSTGISLDRYDDLVTRLVAIAEGKFGTSINTDEDEYFGHDIRNVSLLTSEINEILQDVYDSSSVKDSFGVRLDNLLELVGISRQEATFSTAPLQLTASAATTVPAGTRYATATDLIFTTDEELVFSAAGTGSVASTCTVVGANNAAINEINVIKDSVSRITAVTNTAAATPGRLQETDPELKDRHTTAMQTTGNDDVSSLFLAVSQVSGVSGVYVFDNDTTTAIDGVPAGSIYVTVIGGTAADIAKAIDDNKTAGVPTHGSQTVSVYNETTSQAKDIHYDIAAHAPIFIDLNISVTEGVFPEDGEAQIRANYVTSFANYKTAQDVIYNSLGGPVYQVPGLLVNTIKVGLSASPTGVIDVPLSALQKAQITTAQSATNITITQS